MSRFDEIDEFLKHYSSLFSQNPELEIKSDTFYNGLAMYGLSDFDKENKGIKFYWMDWILYFQTKKNIKVYFDPRQDYFLQFHNNKSFSVSSQSNVDFVKIYVPFKKRNMRENVETLFDFLEKNDIEHYSKVSDMLRSDSVVLRIKNMEDAEKVMEFIDNNEELNNAITNTNPFVMRENKVGLAMDDLLSYNSIVAYLLKEYFIKCKESNYSNVDLNSFRSYVINFYNDTFINGRNLENFRYSDIFLSSYENSYKDYHDLSGCLLNYYQVVKLIITSLDETKTLDDYKNHYRDCNDPEVLKSLNKYFNDKIKNPVEVSNEEDVTKKVLYKEILDAYIIYASKKYGPENVIIYLNSYIYQNNDVAITRDEGFRDKFLKYLPKHLILEIIQNDLESYIDNIQKGKDVDKIQLFEDISIATLKKHGYYQLSGAIKKGIDDGNYDSFTNGSIDENYRLKLIENVKPEELIELCKLYLKSSGYDISSLDNVDEIISSFCNEIQMKVEKDLKAESL